MNDNTTKCTHTPVDFQAQNTGNVQGGKGSSSATAPLETNKKKEGTSPAAGKSAPAKNTTTVVEVLSRLSDEAMARINEILSVAGITVTMEGICNEIKKLEEENRHKQEICNMLTRFRFCPHSEQKRMLFRMSKDIVKIVDDMDLVTPELEGLPVEILDKIRSGEIELVTDEYGNLHVPPTAEATGTTSTCATGSDSDKSPGSNGNSCNNSGSDSSGKNGASGDGTGSNAGDGDSHTSKNPHHARRTKGSLERKFKNVEHRKCYTSYEDDKGCRDNPPLDEDGYPMIYLGERPVRKILVRIPERYIMYECYSQSFRRMTPEERAGEMSPDIPSLDEMEDFKTSTLEGTENIDGVILEVTDSDAESQSFVDELDEGEDDISTEDLEEWEYTLDDAAHTAEQQGLVADYAEKNDRTTDRGEDRTDTSSAHAVSDNEGMKKPSYSPDCVHKDDLLPDLVLLKEQCVETVDPGTGTHSLLGREDTCSVDGLDTVHDPPG